MPDSASVPHGTSARGTLPDALTKSIGLLEREQQELTAPHPESLAAIATEKQVLINEVYALSQAPLHPMRVASLEPEAPADIPNLVRRAQRPNTANAALLAMHRISCESRLRLIRGGDHVGTLYRANGYLGL